MAADNVIVAKPVNAAQISAILRLANRTLTPLYPRSRGTSIVGGPIPTKDGIVTAEHGVGRSRRVYFDRYTDETSKRLMRGIKHLFDPNNILNPDAAIT
ncbi:MAG: FAD-binding protein [Dehalococcoidia bacterium]|nr:FAD-binding protein [Dehalococcoidia bacterium]